MIMKKVSERKKKRKDDNNLIHKEKDPNTFKSKQNIKPEKENHELSPIALMKHRIEEMNRKLFEKRNQRK